MAPAPTVELFEGVNPTVNAVPFEQFTLITVLAGVTASPASTVPRSISIGATLIAQVPLTVNLTLNEEVAVAAPATPTKDNAAIASRVFLNDIL